MQTLGGHAFTDCRLLESATLPDSLQTIGEWAFESGQFQMSGGGNLTIVASRGAVGEKFAADHNIRFKAR